MKILLPSNIFILVSVHRTKLCAGYVQKTRHRRFHDTDTDKHPTFEKRFQMSELRIRDNFLGGYWVFLETVCQDPICTNRFELMGSPRHTVHFLDTNIVFSVMHEREMSPYKRMDDLKTLKIQWWCSDPNRRDKRKLTVISVEEIKLHLQNINFYTVLTVWKSDTVCKMSFQYCCIEWRRHWSERKQIQSKYMLLSCGCTGVC